MRASSLVLLAWVAAIAPAAAQNIIALPDPAPDGCQWRQTQHEDWTQVGMFCGGMGQAELLPPGFDRHTVANAHAGDREAMRLLATYYALYGGMEKAAAAHELFVKAAMAGDVQSAVALGHIHEMGLKVPLDMRVAANWYRRAAKLGDADAAHMLGEMLGSDRAQGFAVAGQNGVLPADDTEAAHWFRIAAESGDAAAMSSLADMLAAGRGVARDDAGALHWYSLAAARNFAPAIAALNARHAPVPDVIPVAPIGPVQDIADMAACETLDRPPEMDALPPSLNEQTKQILQMLGAGMRAEAEKGDTKAMVAHGVDLLRSDRQYWKAGECWLRLAGAKGDDYDKFNAGEEYYTFQAHGPLTLPWWSIPSNVTKDDKEAARWMFASAQMGHIMAIDYLGDMYGSGAGVEKDAVESVRWYRLAADKGDFRALEPLADAYSGGFGVPQDDVEAARLLKRATGDGRSLLGAFYANGRANPVNDKRVVWALKAAAESGYVEAMVAMGDCYKAGDGIAADPAKARALYEAAAKLGHKTAIMRLRA